jgi:glutamate/tyrosine decarboxylase-like PLP-dependent enzyme
MTDTRQLLERACQHATEYLERLADAPVGATASLAELRSALCRPLPAMGEDAAAVLDELVRDAEPGLVASAGPRFFGWVIGGSVPAAVAADWLVTAWDQNACTYACSPALAVIEEACRDWIVDLLGLPSQTTIGLVTGCQAAHVTCLAAARHHLLAQRGVDVERDGLVGGPRLRLLATAQRHHTIDRAARLLGLGTGAVTQLRETDGRVALDHLAAELAASDQPTIVLLQAGDINTGHYDPFRDAIPLAHAHHAWVHIDGAFGLWARVSPAHAHLLDGYEQADSWATDAHKWLNTPYDCGIALVAHPSAHRAALSGDASYITRAADGRDQLDWNPEWSRRGRGVPLYAALRSLGRDGIRRLIEDTSRIAAALTSRIAALPGVELLSPACVNQGLVRFLDPTGADHDAHTDRVVRAIQQEGTAFFTASTWSGMRAMRISVCGWRTTDADVERTVTAISVILDQARVAGGELTPRG